MPFANFLRDETGAVTIDWVALTAVVVGLSIPVVFIVSQGTESRADHFVAQTEIWRKGEQTSSNYNAISQDGFDAFLAAFPNMSAEQFSALNSYSNFRVQDPDFGNLDIEEQAYYFELNNALDAFHADHRQIRNRETDFNGATLDQVIDDFNLDDIEAIYDSVDYDALGANGVASAT